MESAKTRSTLKSAWLSFRKENPKTRIRDAAQQMGTTEAEILASFSGDGVVRLDDRFTELWKRMPELGYIMSLTRNTYCVHERKGIFEQVHVNGGHVGYVAGPDIDLRMFFKHWASGFALPDDERTGFKKSIQIFDHQGTAVTKIFLLAESHHDAFERLVQEFAAPDQSPAWSVSAVEPAVFADGRVDQEAFRREWSALKDTHEFYPLLRKYKVSRLHALHIGGPFTRRVGNGSAEKLLLDVSAAGLPMMVFTGSKGNVQIHTGPVKKIVKIPDWINVMDPAFNLHLRTDGIAESWVVRKPTADTDVHSLECYDRDGNLIVQFFGKRKPGIPEDPAWTQYLKTIEKV